MYIYFKYHFLSKILEKMNHSSRNSNKNIIGYIIRIWFLSGLFYSVVFTTLQEINDDANFNFVLETEFWTVILITLLSSLLITLQAYLIIGLFIKFFTTNKLYLWLFSILFSGLIFFAFGAVSPENIISSLNFPFLLYITILSIVIFLLKIKYKEE